MLGNVGTLSGPAGAVGEGMLQASQAWVKKTNSVGGLNGHRVTLIAVDDGGDPARYKASLKDLVENKHVVAFVNNAQELTGQSSNDYLDAKQVPIVGVTGAETWAASTPMIFPQMPVGRPYVNSVIASTAQQAVARGKKNYGALACSEAQVCRDFYTVLDEEVARRGMTLVYKAQVSLAQPDFTAECLSAKNAGVELLMVAADMNTVRRVAASCSRQSFRPLFAAPGTVLDNSVVNEPTLDGLFVANSATAPAWFQSGTPATAEFQRIMKEYGVKASAFHAQAWAAMKILEKALAHVGEPPTSAMILDGLYTIQGDDFGGFTTPITYVRNRPADLPVCWFNVAVKNRAWASPDGFMRNCDPR